MTFTFKPHLVISTVLKPLGFKRQGNCWIKDASTHLYYLKLYSSSSGGPDKYIDIEAFCNEIAAPGKNFRRNYHASIRINEVTELSGAMSYFHEFENLTDEEREIRLKDGLMHYAVPMLEKFGTFTGLKSLWFDNQNISILPELRIRMGLKIGTNREEEIRINRHEEAS